jgi:hypothetical protein
LRDAQNQIEARGARLVVIGNGTAAMAEDFLAERPGPLTVLVDPSRRSYAAAGFRRRMSALQLAQLALNAVRALAKGFRQTAVRGDAHQLGGVMVVAPGERVLMSYASKVAGDHPEPATILAVLDAAAAQP